MSNARNLSKLVPSASGQIQASDIESGAVSSSLGYTPVNKAGDTMTGNLTVQKSSGNSSIAAVASNATGAVNAIENFGVEIATDSTYQGGRFRCGTDYPVSWDNNTLLTKKFKSANGLSVLGATSVGGINSYQSSSGSNVWIWDIKLESALSSAAGALIYWYLSNNPNGGGSGDYRRHASGWIAIATEWHGSGYTPGLTSETVNVNTVGASFDAVIYSNGTSGTVAGEYQSQLNTTQAGNQSVFWAHPSIYLRLKMTGGFNTSYPGQKDLVVFANVIT